MLEKTGIVFPRLRSISFSQTNMKGPSHPSRIKIVELISGYDSILDVGCGTGLAYQMIMNVYPCMDYVGVDVTAKLVAHRRRKWPAAQEHFINLSVYNLEKIGRTFDVVMCRHLLEDLPEYDIAIRKMYPQAVRELLLVFYSKVLASERD